MSWQINFEKCVAFKKEHGRWPSTVTKGEAARRLGVWVNTQRTAAKNSILSDERKMLLDGIGFVWDHSEDAWQVNFKKCAAFKEAHGRWPSHGSKDDAEKRLASWMGTQRQDEKVGELSVERKEKLNEMGFVWNPHGDVWQANFDECVTFKKEHGRWPSRRSKAEAEKLLGSWVDNQRTAAKSCTISDERKKLLDKVGFVWNPREDAWQTNFEECTAFKKEHGRWPSRRSEAETEKLLAIWAGAQRMAGKNGALSDERKKLLDKVGFVWNPREDAWQTNFEECTAFKKEHGRWPSRRSEAETEKLLAIWAGAQRMAGKNGALSDERKKLLEDVGILTSPANSESAPALKPTHQEKVASKVQELTGIVGLKTALEFDVDSDATGNDEVDAQREQMRG